MLKGSLNIRQIGGGGGDEAQFLNKPKFEEGNGKKINLKKQPKKILKST